MPDMGRDAEPTFDDDGRLKVDFGVAAGVEPDTFDDDRVGGGAETGERERRFAEPDDVARPRQPETITPGPAPTGEEPTQVDEPSKPLVLDLNMNKVKLRDLRACERILLAVYGKPYPVMPMLEELPADITIALLAHKILLADEIDCSRMSEEDALKAADTIRPAFEQAEEIDFFQLGQPAPAEGEGKSPTDPSNGSTGNGQRQNEPDGSRSAQPS